MTKVKGLTFEEAFEKSDIKVIDDIPVRLIHYHHLIATKKQAGRRKI